MKSKSENIRQMLRDIQAKREKLDYAERKLRRQLASLEAKGVRETTSSSASSLQGQSAPDERQPHSEIKRSAAFAVAQGKESVSDRSEVYDLTPDLRKIVAAKGGVNYSTLLSALRTNTERFSKAGVIVKLNLNNIGMSHGLMVQYYQHLVAANLPNLELTVVK